MTLLKTKTKPKKKNPQKRAAANGSTEEVARGRQSLEDPPLTMVDELSPRAGCGGHCLRCV